LVETVKGEGGSGDGLNVLTVCNTGSLATSVRDVFLLSRMTARLNVILYDRDMAPPLDLSPISTKRGSSGEHIIRRRRHITRVPGAEASHDPLCAHGIDHPRLTALELKTLQIPSTMIVDTMVGSLFQHHKIYAVGVCPTPLAITSCLAYEVPASCGSGPDSCER